jgi:ribosomal silencing factor RsfS
MTGLRRFWDEHPRLSMWIVLAIGMVIIMVFSARHVGFTALQWLWLVLMTIGLAGLCSWIVNWGGQEDEE